MRVLTLFIAALFVPSVAAAAPAKSDPFLDDIQRRCFLFFWKEAHPDTGLVKDRSGNFRQDDYDVASIAATGFGLSALPIGVERGWVKRDDARQRALKTLQVFDTRIQHDHGIYPHFLKMDTLERAWDSEFSTIDTTLLLAGAITAGEYFGGDVRTLADRLYRRLDWKYWSPRGLTSHGSRPEQGQYLPYDYGGYCEAMLLYVMAIGSPSHPLPPSTWYRVHRPLGRYGPYSTIEGSSLFVNQYQNLWVDLRNRNDGLADYFELLRANTMANRRFCMDQVRKYPNFGPDEWGLTAGDGPDGYRAWGALPGYTELDGTLNPHAAGGSYEGTPELSRRALAHMKRKYGAKLYGRYGFSDGYNVSRKWFGPDVVGIDTGATLLAIENHRTGLVRRLFMRHAAMQTAIRRIGLKPNPERTPALRVAPLVSVAHGSQPGRYHTTARASFTPTTAHRRAWKDRTIYLYGGLAEGPVTLVLNGNEIGRWSGKPDERSPVAFAVPATALKCGRKNDLRVTVEATKNGVTTYGPIYLGPKPALDNKPLVTKAAEGAG